MQRCGACEPCHTTDSAVTQKAMLGVLLMLPPTAATGRGAQHVAANHLQLHHHHQMAVAVGPQMHLRLALPET